MKETVSIRGMAKVNLGLDVLRRREDGYHDVKMIMQTVNLYDVLTFKKTKSPGIQISCDGADLPTDKHNLIYKAASCFYRTFPEEGGISVTLKKQIPVAAGMAGGSTDAAVTFIAMNEIYGTGLRKDELARMAVKVGADVPFCIYGGTCLSEGIGEILTPVKNNLRCNVLIAKPDISVSTKYVYDNLHVDRIQKHPDIDGMTAALEQGDLKKMAGKMENILEHVTARSYPEIEELKQCMIQMGALNAIMSGSGPTVFGIFENKSLAETALEEIRRKKFVEQSCITTFTDKTGVPEQEVL